MIIKKREKDKKLVFILIVVCIFISAIFICNNNQYKDRNYNDYMYEFYEIYFQIAETIDNISSKDIKILRESENQQEINELNTILMAMENDIPKNKKSNYNKLNNWYIELVELSDEKYENWWELTIEERRKAYTQMVIIRLRLVDWQDNKSGIAWEK
ncbi:hypothetical protein SH1V18_45440 [Vallitalea longa]|uniref:Uncharacterized protein n=1 Tax=Vallitalea longa TaxID=2936439 RepID=A0A9W5YHK6_9FIRM|nr:hypothetical protein [Vallitalea longa]GKX32064.1 hypothetical protein SH1V18_45440 [Vallitalea longa]